MDDAIDLASLITRQKSSDRPDHLLIVADAESLGELSLNFTARPQW